MSRASNWATPDDMDALFGDRSARPTQRRQQPERYFTDRIKRYARRGGWLPYHNLRPKGSDPGFLDLTLLRVPRLVVAELKVPPNVTPSEWQSAWIETWKTLALLTGPHMTIEVYLWTPDDWPEIMAVLE